MEDLGISWLKELMSYPGIVPTPNYPGNISLPSQIVHWFTIEPIYTEPQNISSDQICGNKSRAKERTASGHSEVYPMPRKQKGHPWLTPALD